MLEKTEPVPGVRRRLMSEADIDAAATLLSVGFPHRGRAAWLAGLHRHRTRAVPEGFPRFGLLLEAPNALVGILLTIYAEIEDDGRRFVRCNFSSWYVDRAFAAYSALLVSHLLRDKRVTFVNISPAPHTGEIIASQGFRPFSTGWMLTLPCVRRGREPVRVTVFEGHAGTAADTLNERHLLEQHHSFGCVCLLVDAKDGCHPFVFTSRRRVGRLVATSYLVYCRDLADYARFAGPLGRMLLRYGIGTVIVDGEARRSAVAGLPISRTQHKYFRGPDRPRAGDHSFSELAIFN